MIIFVVFPLFSEIKKNSQDILSQKQELASLEAKATDLESFRIILPEIESNLDKVNALFVDPEVPVDFINFLEKTSADCQMSLKISPAFPGKTPGEPWPFLIFQINSSGLSSNFLKFLEKLEASPYLIKLQNLNMGRMGDGVSVNLSMKVYSK